MESGNLTSNEKSKYQVSKLIFIQEFETKKNHLTCIYFYGSPIYIVVVISMSRWILTFDIGIQYSTQLLPAYLPVNSSEEYFQGPR